MTKEEIKLLKADDIELLVMMSAALFVFRENQTIDGAFQEAEDFVSAAKERYEPK